jgi:hypothetical protein
VKAVVDMGTKADFRSDSTMGLRIFHAVKIDAQKLRSVVHDKYIRVNTFFLAGFTMRLSRLYARQRTLRMSL